MRAGSVFRRCGRCDARLDGKRCARCGYERFTWGYVLDLTEKDGQGKLIGKRRQRKRFGFATKAEAIAAMNEYQVSRAAGTHIERSRLTVGQYLDEWLVRVSGEVTDNTRRSYELAVARVRPIIGTLALQELTPADVRAAYRKLAAEGRMPRRKVTDDGAEPARPAGLAKKTVHNTHLAIRRALRDAVRDRLVSFNAAEAAHRLTEDDKPEIQYWDRDELKAFLRSVADHDLYPLWLVAASTGLRRGELLGLRWRDADRDLRRLHIRQQRKRRAEATENGGNRYVWSFGVVKTKAGRRTIVLDKASTAALTAMRQARTTVLAELGGRLIGPDDLVFARLDGTPHDPDVISQTFDRLVTAAKLRSIRFHDLRHTHATLLLAAGEHPKVVQERLGHASIQVTIDLYSHVIPSLQENAADRFSALLDDDPDDQP